MRRENPPLSKKKKERKKKTKMYDGTNEPRARSINYRWTRDAVRIIFYVFLLLLLQLFDYLLL